METDIIIIQGIMLFTFLCAAAYIIAGITTGVLDHAISTLISPPKPSRYKLMCFTYVVLWLATVGYVVFYTLTLFVL